MDSTSDVRGRMEVAQPISTAIDYVKAFLFTPFDFNRWLTIGLIIFLDMIGRGGGFGYNFPNPTDRVTSGMLSDAWEWIQANLVLTISITLVAFLIMVVITVLILWVNSRGQFMFVRALCTGQLDIGVNWRETAVPAHSLFLFRIALVVVASVITVGMGGLIIISYPGFGPEIVPNKAVAVVVTVLLFLLGITLAVLFTLVASFLRNMVVPLMYRFDLNCMDAWRFFLKIAGNNVVPLILFVLVRIGITIVIAVASVLVLVLGCCITCGMMGIAAILPFVMTLILAILLSPLFVFERSYSIFVLETLGPDFQMIPRREGLEDPLAPRYPEF